MVSQGSQALSSSSSTATHLFAIVYLLRILRTTWLHDRRWRRFLIRDLRNVQPLLRLGRIEAGAGHRHQRARARGDPRVDGVAVLTDGAVVIPLQAGAGGTVQRHELIVEPVAPPVSAFADQPLTEDVLGSLSVRTVHVFGDAEHRLRVTEGFEDGVALDGTQLRYLHIAVGELPVNPLHACFEDGHPVRLAHSTMRGIPAVSQLVE